MRVKKLEIFGFKSFALRQSITFGEGITGIVGPNGCGKSNVVDALRWVMGEQNARHLRGGNMQDIIFCGSEKKAPLGFAEVTLTIENNEQDAPLEYNHFQEIEITRRLYKTGESEYEINRQKARLKDISDFFLGTGVGTKAYSIIEQGRINDVISAKPVDRRLIIEEAAGITKYKAKKAIAERRMEATRVNLERIIDIKNEVDKRVAALMREKEKLEKVLAIKNRIKEIDIHLASQRYFSSSSELRYLNRTKEQLTHDLYENKQEIAAIEQNFSKILEEYSRVHEQRRLLEELESQHKTSLELLKKDLEYTKTTLSDNQNLTARISSQLEEIDKRKSDLALDIEKFTDEQAKALADYEQINHQLIAKKHDGQGVINRRQENIIRERDTQKKILEAATSAAKLQTEITVLRDQEVQKQIDLKNQTAELAIKADEINAQKNRLEVLVVELEQGLAQKVALQQQFDQLEQDLQKSRQAGTSLKNQMRELDATKMGLSSRLKSLKEIVERCEWSESGVVDLLASDQQHLIKGVIADIIQVKPGYEDSVEKYLAHVLDAAVIASNEDLLVIANFLKGNKSQETSFFLLNNNEVRHTIAKPIGLKSISELIQINDKHYAGLMSQFERFFLSDNLDTALLHWPAAQMAQATIISAEGEMLLPDGRAIIFGQNNGKGVLKRKNELMQLEQDLASLEIAIEDLALTIKQADESTLAINAAKEKTNEELKPLILGIVRLEEVVKQKRTECTRLETEIAKLEEKNKNLIKNAESGDEKIATLTKLWSSALENHKLEEDALFLITQEKGASDAEYDSFLQEIKQIEVTRAGCYEKSQNLKNTLSQAQKTLDHLLTQKISFEEQMESIFGDELKLKENERQIEKKLASLTKEIDETIKMLDSVRKTCGERALQKQTFELQMGDLQTKGRLLVEKLHGQELKINNVNNDIKNLCDRIREKHQLELTYQVIDFHHRLIEEKSAQKELDDLIKQKDRQGAVNENAGIEFDELSARSTFLESQVNDLQDALAQLEGAIKKINKTTKMRFLEAFNCINKQFSQVFPRLFNGGKAELLLCDQEDLLNCGVEIIAKPPGKNIGSIELMSGGEKALTAISLIMAIFLIKPSPFCLLDEVDAPLDETNVARFSHLIKEMSALSQFIVITHNRKTMESADQLYGVTMEDAGLSKIVSVHVQQAFEALQQKTPPAKAVKGQQLSLDDVIS